MQTQSDLQHPNFHRREFLQAGALAALGGLSISDVAALQAEQQDAARGPRRQLAVIYIVLTGGLAQHESFDPKPEAPVNIRGEFETIQTKTPGLFISEHLPMLAARSDKWAVCRSLSHTWNEHIQATSMMLTGRSVLSPNFSRIPKPTDFPGIASVAGRMVLPHNSLPSAAVLPYSIETPGTKAGMMGSRHDPWMIKAASDCKWSGACPNCWDHQRRPVQQHTGWPVFQAPNLRLPDGITQPRLDARKSLLQVVEDRQRKLDASSATVSLDTYRSGALSLLTSGKVRSAFDINNEAPKTLDAYGRNLFGYSLLFAARLVELGVSMIQVNLGRGGFDTHGNAFDHLKNLMLPPTDQAMSALLDDLDGRGLLDDTLIVAAGEFGRTPKIFRLPQFYELPGRDHWGAVQSVFFAGGGVRGGNVIGASDRHGGYPKEAKQTPENLAASIYDALGIDAHAAWKDSNGRPYHVYHAEPIEGLV
ncbi:MAG: hypothetical protein CMJ78_18935 [Planctomycetaceae bacterium]|nr:hypothetical protein [Planctomycetaceae bacterium]